MTETWKGVEEPQPEPLTAGGWVRMTCRGLVLGTVVFGGLVILLLVRLFERPLCGVRRPVTPYITQTVCKAAFVILGIKHSVRGEPLRSGGAVVANHVSWLDIFSLNAVKRIYFVSKSEVAGWFGIGWLARATGTVFIERGRRSKAQEQTQLLQERLNAGHVLLFFPEGTSSDGLRVLPFKSTLFEAFLKDPLRAQLRIQAVTLNYIPPKGEEAHFYGWWGDMEIAQHIIQTLAARRQGAIEVVYHHPVQVADFPNRKALAASLEAQVRSGLTTPVYTADSS